MTSKGSKKSNLSEDQQKQLDIQEHEEEIFYSPRCGSSRFLARFSC